MKKNYMKKLTALVLGGLMTTTMASAAMAESVDMTLEESVRTALDNNYSRRLNTIVLYGPAIRLAAALALL